MKAKEVQAGGENNDELDELRRQVQARKQN